jgi:hypothetical protein
VRRLALWLGLITCLLLTGVWVASAFYEFQAQITGGSAIYGVDVGSGSILFERLHATHIRARPWQFTTRWSRHTPSLEPWTPRLSVSSPADAVRAEFIDLLIPLWIPVALVAAPAAWLAFRSRRDAHATRHAPTCSNCSYSRAGLAPGTSCPECGVIAPAQTTACPARR